MASFAARPRAEFRRFLSTHVDTDMVSIGGVLEWLHAHLITCAAQYRAVLLVISRHIERQLIVQEWPIGSLDRVRKYAPTTDPTVRKMMFRHNMTVSKLRSSKVLVKQKIHKMKKHRLLDLQMRLSLHNYLMSCSHHFSGAVDVAVAADASRFGGEELLAAAFMNLDTGVTCWAPPQVPPAHF